MTTNGKNKKAVENAHHIFGSSDINNIPVGITVSQLWAHLYLLDSDILRDKKRFLLANVLYLQAVLDAREEIPEDTLGHILEKYVDVNVRLILETSLALGSIWC